MNMPFKECILRDDRPICMIVGAILITGFFILCILVYYGVISKIFGRMVFL